MKLADLCSKQAGTCFETGGHLFQSWQTRVSKQVTDCLKSYVHVSKQSGACFKQHIPSRLTLQTLILNIKKMEISE